MLWWIPVGLAVGTLGTLVGAGGGFLLGPVLLLAYPHDSPETIASISLAVVFLNALSGTFAYARMKRVDYRSGFLLSAATIPGAILGAVTTAFVPRRTFDLLFAPRAAGRGRADPVAATHARRHRTRELSPGGDRSRRHGPRVFLQSVPGGGDLAGRGLRVESPGHRRRDHPRAGADGGAGLPGPHRHPRRRISRSPGWPAPGRSSISRPAPCGAA